MNIESLRLRDFRNYTKLELTPHPGINLLFGQNGSGKTNLLEAVHYCALGRSHRISSDREVVRRDCEMGACGVIVRRGDTKTDVMVRLTPNEGKKKQVFIDRKKADRLSDLMGKVQCVIFSPEDLQLVREGPSVRRRYIDMLLSQLSTRYFVALQQYQKALEERNAILRAVKKSGGPMPDDLLDAFEASMAAPCAVIVPMRRQMIAQIGTIAQEKYGAISGRAREPFGMSYAGCLPDDEAIEQKALSRWREGRREDMLRGGTGFGPHHDDIGLTLAGRELKQFASQGQVRTAALTMKLSQLDIFRSATGETPILLLDDVMSELDMTRRTRLLGEIGNTQTFVTCTDESDLEGCSDRRTYRVSLNEDLQASVKETQEGEKAETVKAEEEEPDFS